MLLLFTFSATINTEVREVNLLNPHRCQTSLAILSAKILNVVSVFSYRPNSSCPSVQPFNTSPYLAQLNPGVLLCCCCCVLFFPPSSGFSSGATVWPWKHRPGCGQTKSKNASWSPGQEAGESTSCRLPSMFTLCKCVWLRVEEERGNRGRRVARAHGRGGFGGGWYVVWDFSLSC